VWTGDPDCNAAHVALLQRLQAFGTPFIGTGEAITLSQQGNLGEFISLHIALSGPLGTMEKFAQNALQPLSGISISGLDLTYVYFDPTSEKNDLIYIQEVKTTCAANLNTLDKLRTDYRKLFSTDLNLTLQTRIQCLASKFEIERNNPGHAVRVQKLAATTPQQCTSVRLIPTGVHQLGVGDPVQKMVAIKTAITAFGWDQAAISPWAVALSDLSNRLLHLAQAQL